MSGSLRDQLKEIKETMEDMRIMIKYLEFDVEATRREREYYKKLVEKK